MGHIKITTLLLLSFVFFACNTKQKEQNNKKETVEIKLDSTEEFSEPKQNETNQNETKFNSNLRPNKPVLLNQIYIDTIVFLSYNDDGDYFLLIGKKNGVDIAFIYNWERNETNKYNFKYGDILKVKWKMKSISIAGDDESLDYIESAIDAEKIKEKKQQVKFLWRADKYDKDLMQNYNTIFINEQFANSISDQEKAALGYVATFVGNECEWDGNVNENRSNLKCEILTALDLGYQCSDKHLGFLRNWFSKDSVALKKLEPCGTMPNTATIQTTFNEITILTDKTNKTISVKYKVMGINIRESRNWFWEKTDIFKYDLENITLIDSKKTELEGISFNKESIKELMHLTKINVIKKYGNPSSDEQFILDDAQGEFRNRITDKYTEKEKQNGPILINEVTWEKDENTWITVWYEMDLGEAVLTKDVFVWKKGTEF